MVRVLRVTQITQGCCRSGGKKFRLVSFETESGQSPVHPLSARPARQALRFPPADQLLCFFCAAATRAPTTRVCVAMAMSSRD